MNYREHQRSSTNVLCVEFNEFQSDIETFWSLWEWADVELNGLKSLEMPPMDCVILSIILQQTQSI